MATDSDPLIAMLQRSFLEADRARLAAAELPARLVDLRTLVRAAIDACPSEISRLARLYPELARLLPKR